MDIGGLWKERFVNAQAKFAPDPADDKLTICVGRGIEWTHAPFGLGTGYTANPIRGCRHNCQWRMPDGKTVICYAQSQRDRMDGEGAFQNITFHPDVFDKVKKHKQRAGIFFDSMSDLCGEGVEPEWIESCIQCMKDCPQHIFFVLTKNPRRLTEFTWPDNAFMGVSAPPTFMYGKELNPEQQSVWFRKAMDWLFLCRAKWKWASLEPLQADVCQTLRLARINWAVIGAGSDGRKTYQPDEGLFHDTLAALRGVPIFYKGNLDRALAGRHGGWREEFVKLYGYP